MHGVVHHIEMYVDNLQETKNFWSWLLLDYLGYKVSQEWNHGISYKLGDTYLVFVQTKDPHKKIKYHRCKSGLNHLAFHVKSKEFVDKMTKKLEEKGINILYRDRHPYAGGKDYYAVYFEDNNRMKVELVAD